MQRVRRHHPLSPSAAALLLLAVALLLLPIMPAASSYPLDPDFSDFADCEKGLNVRGVNLFNTPLYTSDPNGCLKECRWQDDCDFVIYGKNRTCWLRQSFAAGYGYPYQGHNGPDASVEFSCFNIRAIGFSDCKPGVNRKGGDLPGMPLNKPDAPACMRACGAEPKCDFFVYNNEEKCWLKSVNGTEGFDGPDSSVVQLCTNDHHEVHPRSAYTHGVG